MTDEIARLVSAARSAADPAAGHRAFAELVRRFQDMALGCSLGMLGDLQLAEDVAQDAFLAAYANLDKLEDPRAFPGWFKQIVRHKSQRVLRHRNRVPLDSVGIDAMEVAGNAPAQDEQVERNQQRDLIHRAVANLPEHERLATTLFYLTGYSQRQIAEFLDLPDATVRKRLQRARDRLKERMMDMVEETFAGHRLQPDFADQIIDMIRAAETGDLSHIGALLSRNPALVEADAPLSDDYPVRAEGWKALHIAAWHGRARTVQFLLDQGADIDARCAGGRTPLHYAVEAGNEETRRRLIDRGAAIDIALAALLGMEDKVREILDADPALADDGSTGSLPLEWAAWGGQLDIARLLVARGARSDDPAAAFACASNGSADILRLLLESGLDPKTRWRGQTLLHAAVEMHFAEDNAEIAELLIGRGAEVNALDEAHRTPLDIAVAKGGQGKFTLNPHEAPNERRQYDRLAALLRRHGGVCRQASP